MRTLLAPHQVEPVPELPPFQGGAAGYIGYDWGAMLERIPRPRYDDLAIPDVVLGLYDWVIAWDHQGQRAWVISTGIPEQGTARTERAAERLKFVRKRLAGRGAPKDSPTGAGGGGGRGGGTGRLTPHPPDRPSPPSPPPPPPPPPPPVGARPHLPPAAPPHPGPPPTPDPHPRR